MLALLLMTGCHDARPAAETAQSPAPRAPVPVERACRRAAHRTGLPSACPTTWPQHGGPGEPKARLLRWSARAYLIDVSNGYSHQPYVFHVLIGAQRRPFGAWPSRTAVELGLPSKTVKLRMRGGGYFVRQRAATPVATLHVTGGTGLVLAAPPFPAGGIHGGHLIAIWNHRNHGYVISIHGYKLRRRQLVQIVQRMAGSAAYSNDAPNRTPSAYDEERPSRP